MKNTLLNRAFEAEHKVNNSKTELNLVSDVNGVLKYVDALFSDVNTGLKEYTKKQSELDNLNKELNSDVDKLQAVAEDGDRIYTEYTKAIESLGVKPSAEAKKLSTEVQKAYKLVDHAYGVLKQ